jgi:hypothetical protein
MHIPGSRTAHHLLKRFVTWPLTDALATWEASHQRRLGPSLQQGPMVTPSGTSRAVGLTLAEWAGIVNEHSERGSRFFSDNLVSNESSYLQVAEVLERVPKGLAYIGVGPEQSFSYVATLEPSLAFVVDIRRNNLTQHLLYKALFEEAATRAEWLSLLLGREAEPQPDVEAPLAVVLESVERSPPHGAAFARAHARVRARLEPLSRFLSRAPDWRTLERIHRRFFRQQLGITFCLHKPGRHSYPTLRSLLLALSPDGRAHSFLGTEDRYASVRRLQREHRIVPLVGDFTGHRALAGIAELLGQRGSAVGVVYASNVEQMVWEEHRWRHWIRNLRALPLAPEALLVRCYIDQGRAHMRQLPGHRTTTLAQSARGFLERELCRPYRDHWDVVAGDPDIVGFHVT